MKRYFYLLLVLITVLTGCSAEERKYIVAELPEQKRTAERKLREEITIEGTVTAVLGEGGGGHFVVSTDRGLYLIVNLPGVEVKQGDRVRIYGTPMGPGLPTPQINALIIHKL